MTIHTISNQDSLWLPVADFAESCSWEACARMAAAMKENKFSDWEKIFVAEENGVYMGFCALTKAQRFPGLEYEPLIKWLFVGEEYRGQRLSQKLIDAAAQYANRLGFNEAFLTTWHIGLYEKYGFVKICEKEARVGYFEGIYKKSAFCTNIN